jgi:hypothetical protein
VPPNSWSLHALMLRSRLFEEAIAQLWHDGLISGEMHLGSGARRTVQFDVAAEGAKGVVPERWEPLPIEKPVPRRAGGDVTIISVGVHRALEAGVSCRYARVCTRTTIPCARQVEDQVPPNRERICAGVRQLVM